MQRRSEVFTAHDIVEIWTYMTHAEIDALQELVRGLPNNPLVINIGAGAGASGLAIFQARDDVLLYTVDINRDSPLGCLNGENAAFKKAGIDRYHPKHRQILSDSHTAAKRWDHGKADLIFVDDGHGTKEVEGDVDLWREHLVNGGIMVFHDYGSNDWPAVKLVVDDRMKGQRLVKLVDTLAAYQVTR